MAGPSADDLEEIAEGKASAMDKAEAGVRSKSEAQKMLDRHGRRGKVRTTIKRRKRNYG